MSQSNRREELMKVISRVKASEIYGHYIAPNVLEKVVGLVRDHAKYSLSVLNCNTILESLILGMHGMRVILKQESGGLRVLPPDEAVEYGMRQCDIGQQKQAFWHTKLEVCIPLDALAEDVRARYLERRTINARKILAQQTIDLEG